MIDDVRNIVQTIMNKESRGALSPVEFNGLVYTTTMQRFTAYLTEYKTAAYKDNRGFGSFGYANSPKLLRQYLDIFQTSKTIDTTSGSKGDTAVSIPADCAFIQTVAGDGKVAALTDKAVLPFLIGSSKIRPEKDYPQYYQEGNKITVLPEMSKVKVDYIRYPKRPKWTYMEVQGNPVFNPAAPDYQDIELHESELPNIVYDMCVLMGIHLKDGEATQYVEMLKDKKFQKENIA